MTVDKDESHYVGLVDGDNRRHLTIPNIGGAAALCGAGSIVQQIPGQFDPKHPLACPDCTRQIQH